MAASFRRCSARREPAYGGGTTSGHGAGPTQLTQQPRLPAQLADSKTVGTWAPGNPGALLFWEGEDAKEAWELLESQEAEQSRGKSCTSLQQCIPLKPKRFEQISAKCARSLDMMEAGVLWEHGANSMGREAEAAIESGPGGGIVNSEEVVCCQGVRRETGLTYVNDSTRMDSVS